MKRYLTCLVWSSCLIFFISVNSNATDYTRLMDFDGDGKTDVAVYNSAPWAFPIVQTEFKYISSKTGQLVTIPWGQSLDSPCSADYDGDGMTDAAINRWVDANDPQYNYNSWWIKGTTRGDHVRNFGPISYDADRVPGDYDGDGKAEPAVTSTLCELGDPETTDDDYCQYLYWYQLPNEESVASQIIGYYSNNTSHGGGILAPGDYDGDGATNIAVYNPQDKKFVIYAPPYSSISENIISEYNMEVSYPTPGDFNGDGVTDYAGVLNFQSQVAVPMIWKIKYKTRHYTPTVEIQFGMSNEFPVPGDYDGDGKTDIAVYNKDTNQWRIRRSSDLVVVNYVLGDPNDIPTTFPVQNARFFNPSPY